MNRLLVVVVLGLVLMAQGLSVFGAEKEYTVRYICFMSDKTVDLEELQKLSGKELPTVGVKTQEFLDKFKALLPQYNYRLVVSGAQTITTAKPSKAEYRFESADGTSGVALKDEMKLDSTNFGMMLDVRMELTQFGPEEVVAPGGNAAKLGTSRGFNSTIKIEPGSTAMLGSGGDDRGTLLTVASLLEGDQVGFGKD